MTEYCTIGKIAATFGVKGQVVLQHSLGKKTSLKGLDVLFIETRTDEMLPFFIESVTIKNEQELYIKLEGINTREEAQKLAQKQVWLTEDKFHKYASKSAPISLLGFEIIDQGKSLGPVLEVIEQPHQLLCRIDWQGREALIPVHENFLVKIDAKKKQVVLDLPDGLLDVF